MNHNQIALIILDGWGYREETEHNAIAKAKTPFFDSLWNEYPHTLLGASEEDVGLPSGQIGNSEVGHTTIGAGKVIDTDLVKINKAAEQGEFETNPVFVKLFEHVKAHTSTLHIKGLVSSGGVHSHEMHLHALLKAAKMHGVEKIAIHVFTDGRDVGPQTGADSLAELERVLEDVGIGRIASATGRLYAMDRDHNWNRTALAEDAMFHGRAGRVHKEKPSEVLRALYKEGVLDELLEPIVFLDEGGNTYTVEANDGILLFNFRPDRMRQISEKIIERTKGNNVHVVSMTEFEPTYGFHVAYPKTEIETTLAAELSKAGLSQVHIAETEKFPHVTYFMNGGKETKHSGEEHVMLESRKDVLTHDLAPKMRAEGIADAAIEHINKGTNFILLNFANPDMVGHTANVPAIIEAVEEVDLQLSRVVNALHARGGVAFITADHGNAEVNFDVATNTKHTAHTTSLVPAIFTKSGITLRSGGGLADIAPTILGLFGVSQPETMTGATLIG